MAFHFEGSIPPQFWMPLTAELGPTTARIQSENNDDLMMISLPSLSMTLNKPLEMNVNGNVTVNGIPHVREIVAKLSSHEGLVNESVWVRANIMITVFGITFYRDLPVWRKIPIPRVRGHLKELWQEMPDTILVNPGGKYLSFYNPPPFFFFFLFFSWLRSSASDTYLIR